MTEDGSWELESYAFEDVEVATPARGETFLQGWRGVGVGTARPSGR